MKRNWPIQTLAWAAIPIVALEALAAIWIQTDNPYPAPRTVGRQFQGWIAASSPTDFQSVAPLPSVPSYNFARYKPGVIGGAAQTTPSTVDQWLPEVSAPVRRLLSDVHYQRYIVAALRRSDVTPDWPFPSPQPPRLPAFRLEGLSIVDPSIFPTTVPSVDGWDPGIGQPQPLRRLREGLSTIDPTAFQSVPSLSSWHFQSPGPLPQRRIPAGEKAETPTPEFLTVDKWGFAFPQPGRTVSFRHVLSPISPFFRIIPEVRVSDFQAQISQPYLTRRLVQEGWVAWNPILPPTVTVDQWFTLHPYTVRPVKILEGITLTDPSSFLSVPPVASWMFPVEQPFPDYQRRRVLRPGEFAWNTSTPAAPPPPPSTVEEAILVGGVTNTLNIGQGSMGEM